MYRQVRPHPALQPYIDAYWISRSAVASSTRILPDGCVDIILNAGADCGSASEAVRNGKIYLIGTMTRAKTAEMAAESLLIGVRFKPAAFSVFYRFTSLDQVTDLTLELDSGFAFDLKELRRDLQGYLNRYFLGRLVRPRHQLFPVLADMEHHGGQMRMADLASRHCTTVRQLERGFRQHVGIGPKAFMNLLRFRSVLPALQDRPEGSSLQALAFEHGYYDHAHLSAEIRRFTGLPPTRL
ncbi:hypothetical protein C7T94_06205 [Pedobacter yulinensis]|uniref:HTH araC/xylS-type domain-containing protein n=1 Tax=Pedobacter yulinensis TaxID=2126353 RepID=A0A2T3HPC6_9SPHI|nr:helix-turn-helix domain-containing protein [Pedobacter yulinensis]PST84305.1 hypothetical protein C7T94_06205 [Pedobacter yulinensis]